MYSKQHAVARDSIEGGMTATDRMQRVAGGTVNVLKKLCSHVLCAKYPTFSIEGIKPVVYCEQHTEDSRVDVCSKNYSHDSYSTGPARGVLTNAADTARTRHKNGILDGSVVNPCSLFSEVVGWRKQSRSDLDGKQPVLCINPRHL